MLAVGLLQLLGASFVSRLLIDPGDVWTGKISQPGPQVITGMRGCGKTMLLKALEIHARINRAQQNSDGDRSRLNAELEADSYVGFYESSDRLLDGLGSPGLGGPLHRPEARLFLAYARNAVQALRHLQSIAPSLADPLYPERLGRAVERVDVYLRGMSRVRVIWQGDDVISGGSRFTDDSLEQYTRDPNTIKNWLK